MEKKVDKILKKHSTQIDSDELLSHFDRIIDMLNQFPKQRSLKWLETHLTKKMEQDKKKADYQKKYFQDNKKELYRYHNEYRRKHPEYMEKRRERAKKQKDKEDNKHGDNIKKENNS